ncbi:MAG: hypothetical protein ACWA5Q_04980 [bacterium]
MNKPIVLVGVGEMGAVFARGLLRTGYPVYPVTRQSSINAIAATITEPEAVLVAVGEGDLPSVLDTIPSQWHDRVMLLQNELLPADFARFDNPTVISVWFEKKKGMDSKVVIESPAYGPRASMLVDALQSLDIPARELDSAAQLEFELVVKNLYILTSNIAGLKTGGTVSDLWNDYRDFATAVANDVIDLQEALTGNQYDRDDLIAAMLNAFNGDPDHQCMGRSAPARLARAIDHADRLNLEVSTLREIASTT